jgi:hypothetical protein
MIFELYKTCNFVNYLLRAVWIPKIVHRLITNNFSQKILTLFSNTYEEALNVMLAPGRIISGVHRTT